MYKRHTLNQVNVMFKLCTQVEIFFAWIAQAVLLSGNFL